LGGGQRRNHEIFLFISKLTEKIKKWRMRPAPSWKWPLVNNTMYLMFIRSAIAKTHFFYICDMSSINVWGVVRSISNIVFNSPCWFNYPPISLFKYL
jgi:hypothetical protein